jgi:hypothetical protein
VQLVVVGLGLGQGQSFGSEGCVSKVSP